MISRRRFVEAGGALAVGSTLGCEDVPPKLASLLTSRQDSFAAPTTSDVDLVSHVLSRLSFGARPGDYARVRALAPTAERAVERYVAEQLAPESVDDGLLERRLARYAELSAEPGSLYEYKEEVLLEHLTTASLLRARYGERQLHAVMTDFWTDHFNVDSTKGDCRWLKAADDRDVVRRHALGRFPALLRASALSPAMLWYLDGRVNRRAALGDRPNENHARELLELHTLGVHGGYTQRDVMEVARALSGWTVRSRREVVFGLGKVEFHADLHDDGEKHVLGHTLPAGLGARDVDAVLDIVSLHPATARHLATKLCRRFIDDEPPGSAVERVAADFVASRGDIRSTLHTLFATPEFTGARRTKLKRPFHFVASALRGTDATTDGGPALHEFLRRMGQPPFQFSTPDGYPDDQASWLGTLLWRWNFAAALSANRIEGTRVRREALDDSLGGADATWASLLGRRLGSEETRAVASVDDPLALVIASPAFQTY